MTQGRANLLLLFAGAIWGLGFVAQASAVGNVGAFLFIGLRFGLASLTVAPLAIHEARQAKQPLALKDYGGFIFIGLFLSVGSVLQQIGLATTTVTNSGFLTGLYVVMVPIFGVMLFWNWPSPIVWPCALTALGGIYLLSGGQLGNLTTGDWLTILCAAFWALQIIFINRLAHENGRPFMLSLVQFLTCAVFGITIGLFTEPFNLPSIMLSWPAILFGGVFSCGIAFTLQAVGQRYTSAPQAAIMLSSEALFAALFGAILLGERLTFHGVIGCALIFIAMITVELVPALRNRTDAA
ncbi:DMT family transporter [Phyllobacterium sp. OV277]|uniref:DMT family transporter n=1 Tax=Phyllobacterium sp. OV277 TaxID=1882772 RepID=UPI0008850178|nr:DMT family transporter [Phyllobacterium sp. OV277]SDO08116.1 EamA-like transporter family protein [Phyllobacterium sp. OV277]